tara:strand:- start:7273 stop:7791 length:519 start_codon:yes stop_codon:yes gene_type:complete
MNKKMPNQDAYNADQQMGIKSEANTLAVLKKCLGEHIRKSKKEYAVLDFYSTRYKLKAEVKGRRNKHLHYDTTMIGENKILEAERLQESGYETIFFFDFTDKLCYFKFSDFEKLRSHKKMGGTWRRGLREWKLYRYINVNDLTEYDVCSMLPIDYIKTKRKIQKKQKEKKSV